MDGRPRKIPVPDMCPIIYRHIPRDSRDLIPVPRSEGFSILCRVNTSTSLCEWILIATRDRSYYFNRDMKNHIVLHPLGLIVTHMNKELEGEYQILSGLNRTCMGRVLMTAVGPLFIYRIFLLIPGIMFLCGMGLLWDCLIKARNQLAVSEEEQTTSDRIQHVISPSDLSSSL
ncbi:uncharacterized protein LOC134297077 isoform X2 [Anolis carolinensis]|uniref:uncharacterized protein LOC134297077 isoform X2 n=1 Tax=Anolis carolinensis TaxID=28377 RepID=UPI002F2B64E4